MIYGTLSMIKGLMDYQLEVSIKFRYVKIKKIQVCGNKKKIRYADK
jgi:hypothetical protein